QGASRAPRAVSPVPFRWQSETGRLSEWCPDRARVFPPRGGRGLGARQEILTEDVVTLAVLATGRPVASTARVTTSSVRISCLAPNPRPPRGGKTRARSGHHSDSRPVSLCQRNGTGDTARGARLAP
ncbi:hypothetical protein, partial [Clavibacter michiganensis]|uniref:hypothetical protein n=1 Tax=Clavibacter michiganensis TaxID=28447 RepID=UPI002931A14D